MKLQTITICIMAIAIILLFAGIRVNERRRERRLHLVPGGRLMLLSYGLFVTVFAVLVIDFIRTLAA